MSKNRDPFLLIKEDNFSLKKDNFLVGGYLPTFIAEYMRTYALYKNISLSSVLRTILEEWMDKQPTEEILVGDLVERAFMEWCRRDEDDGKAWDIYKKELEGRLKKRKVFEDVINKIMEALETKKEAK